MQSGVFRNCLHRSWRRKPTLTISVNYALDPEIKFTDGQHHPFLVSNRLSSSGYAFDSSGNTTADAVGRTFVYDAENKQISVSDSGGYIGQYSYDGDGKRIKKRAYTSHALTEETTFVYDAAGKLIGEYTQNIANSTDAKVSYLTNDHLGSPRINTDANGAVTARHDYHPFGEEINAGRGSNGEYSPDSVRKKFANYERDEETSLDYAQARYFASGFGRFSSADPLVSSIDINNPQSLNRYVYCINNPYRFVDPSGLVYVYQDSADGKVRTFRWYDNPKDVPKGWTTYSGSVFFIGQSEGIFLGAKGKMEKISLEDAVLGQLDEFLRGPNSPLSYQEKAKLQKAFVNRMMAYHWEDAAIASIIGPILGSLGEAGLRGLFAALSSSAAKSETAGLAGLLREAIKKKGNFGIPLPTAATLDSANALGRAWVGEGYTIASDGATLISEDGLRLYRPPSFKPDLGIVQANYEWRTIARGEWTGNGHVDLPTP